MRLFILMICLATATFGHADIARPFSVDDTLEIMDRAVQDAGFHDVILDRNAQHLQVRMPDGRVTTLYPDALHMGLQAASDDSLRQVLVETLIATLRASGATQPPDSFDADQIRPRLRHITAVQDIPTLVFDPFVGDIVVTYVVDFPTHTAVITDEDLAAQGLTQDALADIALDNLIFAGRDMTIRESTSGLYFIAFDGNHENAFLLDAALWDDLTARLGPLAVTVPNRDLVMIVPQSNADLVKLMVLIRDNALQNSPDPISRQMFTWDRGTWAVLDE